MVLMNLFKIFYIYTYNGRQVAYHPTVTHNLPNRLLTSFVSMIESTAIAETKQIN